MSQPAPPATRIFGVLARAAPRVVLIRRGPSKRVLLLTWDTNRHEFHAGQWLKGRIYEERCDLSPRGEKFIYLAANHKGKLGTWTAVSRPPYLTALVLWPNMGTWGGGGLFESEHVIALNNQYGLKPAEGFRLPRDMRAVPIGRWMGHGEDDPIRTVRMERDGWRLADPGECAGYRSGGRYNFEFTRPERWQKRLRGIILERRLLGIHEHDGPSRAREHHLLDPDGNLLMDLGASDWADWSPVGELLFARGGRVYRIVMRTDGSPQEPEELIDLRALRFEEVPPPREAMDWRAPLKGRRIT